MEASGDDIFFGLLGLFCCSIAVYCAWQFITLIIFKSAILKSCSVLIISATVTTLLRMIVYIVSRYRRLKIGDPVEPTFAPEHHVQAASNPYSSNGSTTRGFPTPNSSIKEESTSAQATDIPQQAEEPLLQDYKMQLMLLEQNNKKRLLMARWEQDNITKGPNGPNGPVPGQPRSFAPAMAPSNSRAGASPGLNEQMRRGTPKTAADVVPSPTADGGMPGRFGKEMNCYTTQRKDFEAGLRREAFLRLAYQLSSTELKEVLQSQPCYRVLSQSPELDSMVEALGLRSS